MRYMRHLLTFAKDVSYMLTIHWIAHSNRKGTECQTSFMN